MAIYLSSWTTFTGPNNNSVTAPLLFRTYSSGVQNMWIAGNMVSPARIPILVLDAPTLTALASDFRFPLLQNYSNSSGTILLSDYQTGMRACHDLRLSQVTITVGQYQIPATKAMQDYLASLDTEFRNGATSITVYFAGTQYTITAAQWATGYKAYLAGLRAVPGANGTGTVDHRLLRSQIEGAQKIADLDAAIIN